MAAVLLRLVPAAGATAEAAVTTRAPDLNPDRYEPALLPAIGYDSDSGFGFGFAASLAKFARDCAPYAWRLQAVGFFTIRDVAKSPTEHAIDMPHFEAVVDLDVPGLFSRAFDLHVRLTLGRYNRTGYYGLGNGVAIDWQRLSQDPRYHFYERLQPRADLGGRIALADTSAGRAEAFVGLHLDGMWLSVYPGSKLATDLAAQNGRPGRLRGLSPHALLTGTAGLVWDSRDHETAPCSGFETEATVRGASGLGESVAFVGLNLTQKAFFSLWGEYLVLAARAMADVMWGDPPLYDLMRHGGTVIDDMTGGAYSIRGVLSQRLYGAQKLLTNLELRQKWLPLEVAGQHFNLGLIAFVDAGRVWLDAGKSSPQDDTGQRPAFAVGLGGGARIQWGEALVLRCDAAYSPTDDTTGFYVNINHIF